MTGKILIEAHELINGERRADYGDPATSFNRVAAGYIGLAGDMADSA